MATAGGDSNAGEGNGNDAGGPGGPNNGGQRGGPGRGESGRDDSRRTAGLSNPGFTREDAVALFEEMSSDYSPGRYDEWTAILNEMREEAAAIAQSDQEFRTQVWEQQLSKEQDLYDLATKAGKEGMRQSGILFDQAQEQYQDYQQNFQPQETAIAANAMGLQYLAPDQQAAMLSAMQDPNLTTPQRQQVLNEFQQMAQGAARGEVMGNADQIQNDLAARAREIEQYYGREAAELYAREASRAMQAEAQGRTQNSAAINSAYGQQAREMGRRGFNPAQIAAAATAQTRDQALAQVTGNNQLYGITADRLRQADDISTAMRQQGALTGMDTRYAGEDTARTMRMGADQAVRDHFSGMQSQAAAFGRSLPQYGLGAAQTGGQLQQGAVQNQATGFSAALPYAQFATGGTGYGLQATGLGQQGALGMNNILSQDWQTKYRTDNAPEAGGSNSSNMLGAIAGGALAMFSDPALKENEVPVGMWNDLTVYRFNYKGDTTPRLGFMATEVLQKVPAAVDRLAGYLRVNYQKIGEAYGV